MEKLWESDAYVDENTLSVNVNRLRKKLSAVGLDGFILTKKGMGTGSDENMEKFCQTKYRVDDSVSSVVFSACIISVPDRPNRG